MTDFGALLKTSLFQSARGPVLPEAQKKQRRQSRGGQWSVLLGGLLSALLLGASAQANPLPVAPMAASQTHAQAVTLPQGVEDGIYFYGEVPQPDQLGAAYMVFEARDAQVTGAMFMPHSSFDCFQGQISGRELALQITNSYTQETYGYAIALVTSEDPIATVGNAQVPLRLDGFFNLGTAREAELAILETCQVQGHPQAELEI